MWDQGIVYNDGVAITTSDTVNLAKLTDGVFVGGAGTVAAVLPNDRVVTLTLTAPYLVPIRAKRINATGTSATALVALYVT